MADYQQQVERWLEEGDYSQVAATIVAIPAAERDYRLTCQLALALDHLGNHLDAVTQLLTLSQAGQEDPDWHTQLGYAYFHLERTAAAQREFETALALKPGDSDSQRGLAACQRQIAGAACRQRLEQQALDWEEITWGTTFRQRADQFWQWFSDNEAHLAEMVEHHGRFDSEEIVAFISQGVTLIGQDIPFNIGGNYEFAFAVEGQDYLFYLLPWLVARQPEALRARWHFSPYLPGSSQQDYALGIYGQQISMGEVQVAITYDEEHNRFDLRFYAAKLNQLAENERLNAFYMMMELTIGEGLSRVYIREAQPAAAPTADMFPLPQLQQEMAATLAAAEQKMEQQPGHRYSAYESQPRGCENLRDDVIFGISCFLPLVNQFYQEESSIADQLSHYGAVAAFLLFPYGETPPREVLDLRHALEDRLEQEVLGERGNGQEIGLLLGGAMGTQYAYIDLLLYDAPAFGQRLPSLLADFPYPCYLAEFWQQGQVVRLNKKK